MGIYFETRLKDIGNNLNGKLEELISYLPLQLKDDMKKEAYLAGGCIYSEYNFRKPKDYDVFIETEEFKDKLLDFFKSLPGIKTKYYKGKLVYYTDYLYMSVFITENAITLGEFQIILKDLGKPEDVVGKFDFKHNMHYLKNGKIKALDDDYNLSTNDLLFNEKRARDIVSTIMRTNKFVRRGFTLSDEELRKMLLQLSETGFSDDEILLLTESDTNSTSFGSGH